MGNRIRLGLQLSSVDSGFKTDISTAIEKVCLKENTDLLIFLGGDDSGESFNNQQSAIYSLISKNNVDSLIVTSEMFANNRSLFFSAEGHKSVPELSITHTKCKDFCIESDYREKYTALISHMINVHNCKTFAIVAGDKNDSESSERLELSLNALSKNGISIPKENIFFSTFEEEGGYTAMIHFLNAHILPVDCIIALNDDMAIGITDFSRSHNMLIPEDFRLIGFDDIIRSRFNSISITTLHRDIKTLCSESVKDAILLAKGTQNLPFRPLPCALRFRKSCGCVPPRDFTTDYIDEKQTAVPFNTELFHNLSAEYYALEHEMGLMKRFFTNLSDSLTLQAAISHLESSLPSLHIHSCAVILFERKITIKKAGDFELPSRASLILNYESGVEHKSGQVFNPQNSFLPENNFSDRRRTLFLQTLYFENAVFGYVCYEPGDLHQSLYDTAFSMVANTLNTAILFTQKTATEQHQTAMLQQLKNSNTRLSGISLTDELTGLYNRRGLMNFGQQTIDLTIEMEQHGLVFYADMDGLKKINDTYGHDAGDLAIKAMGSILKQVFRNQDIVARIGGDEFVIVATGITEKFLPSIRARIMAAEEKWFHENQPDFHLGISFGATPFGIFKEKDGNGEAVQADVEADLERLLACADKLLYSEKQKKHTRSATKELL